jgi:hypothetical protein
MTKTLSKNKATIESYFRVLISAGKISKLASSGIKINTKLTLLKV